MRDVLYFKQWEAALPRGFDKVRSRASPSASLPAWRCWHVSLAPPAAVQGAEAEEAGRACRMAEREARRAGRAEEDAARGVDAAALRARAPCSLFAGVNTLALEHSTALLRDGAGIVNRGCTLN